jgi:KipI family sensor histidine kinase inhibitor
VFPFKFVFRCSLFVVPGSVAPTPVRIREAGDSAVLLEWEEVIDPRVNARAIAAAAAVRNASLPGVRDVVSTYRSVAIFFDPLKAEPDVFRDSVAWMSEAPVEVIRGKTIEVPVAYGGDAGPDLAAVAEWAGISAEAVAERHAGTAYRVFMLGFLPGFAYLGSVDARIAAPRRATPRLRVPQGSVGIAGAQTGIYPRQSAGGWQIIGRSALKIFDPSHVPAALFEPGDVVRFKPVSFGETGSEGASRVASVQRAVPDSRTLTIARPGLFTTIQDQGRWGHQASGVSVSGALDLVSHRVANLLVGNPADAATLEVTLVGPELTIEQETTIAIAGADLQASIDGAAVPMGAATTCRPGSVLRFGERASGARAYVAFDGGIDSPIVLGSRATHIGAALGGVDGRALMTGDRLALGPPTRTRTVRSTGAMKGSQPTAGTAGGARLRVLPGPQDDFFAESTFTLLERTRFIVTPQSNRMGYRLSGTTLPRIPKREMISDAAFVGGLQVPPSGEPILLMSDRQTTGGYPQMATVITADLPLAGQLAPGDWVEFTRCTRAEAIAALRDQEAMLRGHT